MTGAALLEQETLADFLDICTGCRQAGKMRIFHRYRGLHLIFPGNMLHEWHEQ